MATYHSPKSENKSLPVSLQEEIQIKTENKKILSCPHLPDIFQEPCLQCRSKEKSSHSQAALFLSIIFDTPHQHRKQFFAELLLLLTAGSN